MYKKLLKQQLGSLGENITDFDRKILFSLISKNPMEQNVPKLDISKVLNYEDIAKEEN